MPTVFLRLLPVMPHEELDLRDPVESEEDLQVGIKAMADVGLAGIGDRCVLEHGK